MIDKKTYRLLRKFYRKDKLSIKDVSKITGVDESNQSSRYIDVLFTAKYIQEWHSNKVVGVFGETERLGFQITLGGRAYVEYRQRDARNFWVPYAITTLIALMSLIASLAEHWGTIMQWFSFCNPCN